MAISFGATTTRNASDASTSVALSHTVDTGSDRILIVTVHWNADADGASITGVSSDVDGALTKLISVDQTPASSLHIITEIWYLVNPTEGAHTITISNDNAGRDLSGIAYNGFGVDQTTPWGTAATGTGNSATATVDVSSATDEVVIDAVTHRDPTQTLTVGSGQTVIDQGDSSADGGSAGGGTSSHDYGTSHEDGAATVTMSWDSSGSQNWSIAGTPLKPAAAAPADDFFLLPRRYVHL